MISDERAREDGVRGDRVRGDLVQDDRVRGDRVRGDPVQGSRDRAPRPRVVRITRQSTLVLAVTAALALLAFTWPLFWPPSASMDGTSQAPLLFALVLPVVIGLALVQVSGDELDVKALALLGVLSAVGAAVRPLGAGTAGIETVFFLLILAGRVFGPGFGFLLGTITLFVSALITAGVGPWLPYQMLASAFCGMGAGLLPRCRGRREIGLLMVYGAVSAFAFGWMMDFAFWPFGLGNVTQFSFDPRASIGHNLHVFVLYNLATSMGWNAGRAVTNAVLIAVLGPSLLRILRRASRRAAFD